MNTSKQAVARVLGEVERASGLCETMGDLQAEQITRLYGELEGWDKLYSAEVAENVKLRARERHYWLALFAVSMVAVLALAKDIGWLG